MTDLIQYLKNNGFDESLIEKFNRYYRLIEEYNEKFNLTSIKDKKEAEFKHFIDSLAAVKLIEGNIADIGAGAGFPSVPLAILRQDCSFTLIDSLNKRIEFLNIVIKELELKNVKAVHIRAEDLKKEEKYDFIVARAVAPLNILCEYCLPFVKINGKFIAYKAGGAAEETKKAANAIGILGGKADKIIECGFEYNEEKFERNLIIIKKIKETPPKYPRGGNKPRLNPIN